MEFAYHLDGGTAPYIKKYQIAEAMALAGIPVIVPTLADTSGVRKCTTTAQTEAVGVTIDVPPTRKTAQDGTDLEALVSVIVNPNAVFWGRLSGGAAAGTILALFANTVASTTGATITTTFSTVYDDGYLFGYDGANAGQLRKCVDAQATDVDFTIPWNFDIAVGDNFLACTFGPAELNAVQLCTELTEIDATGDNQAGVGNRCVEIQFQDRAGEGRQTSRAYIVLTDHLFQSS